MIADTTMAATPNPWRTIWFSPRRTMRHPIDMERWIPVFVLGATGHLLTIINGWWFAPTRQLVARGAFALLFSGLTIWLAPAVLAFYGRLRGGVGSSDHIRIAYGWSYLPLMVGGLGWIPLWLLAGPGYEIGPSGDPSTLVPDVLYLASVGGGDYVDVGVLVAGVSEIHRFSKWRALESTVVTFLLLSLLSVALTRTLGLDTPPPPKLPQSRGIQG